MPTQDEIFLTEGDSWYQRNKSALAMKGQDRIADYVRAHKLGQKAILDIGASNGWRLNLIAPSTNAELHGIEPSSDAVKDGNELFPRLKLTQGVSHDLSAYKDAFFDLVIVSFVFHWIDRARLLRTISEIDRVLSDFGHLVIQDFDPGFACKTAYHHLPDQSVFTYKQPYWEIFTASRMYSTVASQEFAHDDSVAEFNANNLCKMVILQKRGNASYPLINLTN